jgi:hypothetical protein
MGALKDRRSSDGHGPRPEGCLGSGNASAINLRKRSRVRVLADLPAGSRVLRAPAATVVRCGEKAILMRTETHTERGWAGWVGRWVGGGGVTVQ